MFRGLIDGVRTLILQLKEDRVVHQKDTSLPGFRAIAVYRFGVWAKTLPRPIGLPLLVCYLVCYRWIRNHYGIQVYRSAKIGRRVCFGNQGNISIHRDAVIGDDCIIRQNVSIGGVSGLRNESPWLGRGVEIGAGAVIIGKIRVGDRARIGPNVVLTQSVPPGAVVVVPPPRILLRADSGEAPLDRDGQGHGESCALSERAG